MLQFSNISVINYFFHSNFLRLHIRTFWVRNWKWAKKSRFWKATIFSWLVGSRFLGDWGTKRNISQKVLGEGCFFDSDCMSVSAEVYRIRAEGETAASLHTARSLSVQDLVVCDVTRLRVRHLHPHHHQHSHVGHEGAPQNSPSCLYHCDMCLHWSYSRVIPVSVIILISSPYCWTNTNKKWKRNDCLSVL